MKPFNSGGHAAYQNRVLTQLHKYYPNAASSLLPLGMLWRNSNPSTLHLPTPLYRAAIPTLALPPGFPSDMLRFILLSVQFKITSYTKWANFLKENHLYASFPVSMSAISLALTLFMISSAAFGSPIDPPPNLSIHSGKGKKSWIRKGKNLLLKKLRSKSSIPSLEQKSPKDINPRLFNAPPSSSREQELKYNAKTSAKHCNKRKKNDYKLENGRYRSTMMWYCRLFAIMMCQHLDAWNLPTNPWLKDIFEQPA